MKWRKWLENWEMTSLRLNVGFLDMQWQPSDADRKAAWELYVELLTRATTQPLDSHDGDELRALESIQSLFGTTRSVIKTNGRDCQEFTKIAIVILNQVLRPFTSRWHSILLAGGLDSQAEKASFRSELDDLQEILTRYAGMLAEMAGVEDLTTLEEDH